MRRVGSEAEGGIKEKRKGKKEAINLVRALVAQVVVNAHLLGWAYYTRCFSCSILLLQKTLGRIAGAELL